MALNFNARNAMLDFQPITNALYGYTQGVNDNIKRENWNALAGGGMPGVDPAMSQFIKAAGPDKGPDMYMRAYGNAQDRAHRDRQFTASRTDADRSHELQRQQFGISAASNARQAETHRLDIERRRAEARLPVVASILNNSDPASRADQWRQYIETDGDLVRKMPPPYRANPELGARWVYGQAGKAVETGQPKVMEVEPGKSLVRVDPSGRAKEVYTNSAPGKLDSTALKYVYGAQDEMPSIIGAIESLNEAKSLLGSAYHGGVAPVSLSAYNQAMPNSMPNVISSPERAKATLRYNQLMSEQSIASMSQALKGATTDKEMNEFKAIMADPRTPVENKRKTLDAMILKATRQRQILEQRMRDLGARVPGNPPAGLMQDQQQSRNPAQNDPLGIR